MILQYWDETVNPECINEVPLEVMEISVTDINSIMESLRET